MEKKLSAEEVLKKYTFSNILPYSEWLHNAMEEYASQFKGEAVSDAVEEVLRTCGNAQDRMFKEIDKLKEYCQHLPHCNTMQDWTEAEEALSYCPDGPDKDQAYNEMRKKMIACTCGLQQILKTTTNE